MKTSKFVTGLRCTICNRVYAPTENIFTCPEHGNEGILDVEYDYSAIANEISINSLAKSQDFSQWRYSPLLPVHHQTTPPPIPVGWTPLIKADRLAQQCGIGTLHLKDDTRQPTGSLKDRASAVAVMKAKEAGATVITTASTGNAAAALSGMCASAGMECVIFVPSSAPPAKIAQLLAYGAHVYLVEGTYDEAFALCLEASAQFGWYNRNTGYNPYMAEGKKTVAFEICEQLGWQVPDQIYVGVGDGCIISGLHKGFNDMMKLGWIDALPRLMGVQAAGSDYMFRAAASGEDIVSYPPINAATVADSISAGLPRDRIKAARAVNDTGGAWIRVEDEAILSAIPLLAATTGVFAEPAAAASLAGLEEAKRLNLVGPNDSVVLLVTGNGLKDVDSTMKGCAISHKKALTISPTMQDVREKLPSSLN